MWDGTSMSNCTSIGDAKFNNENGKIEDGRRDTAKQAKFAVRSSTALMHHSSPSL